MSQQLVTLTILDNDTLKIAIDDVARVRGTLRHTKKAYQENLREIKDILKRRESNALAEVLEYNLCNSEWDFVRPEEIGALTECAILANWTWRNGHDELLRCGRVFADMNYQMYDCVETLIEQGYVLFEGSGDTEPPYPTQEEIDAEEKRLYGDFAF